jgi:NTE family protein
MFGKNSSGAFVENHRPKVGVVLSSGSIKAFSSLPLFEFLHEENITIDLLVGCSGGSIIAASIGAGMSPREIESKAGQFLNRRLFKKKDIRSLLGMYNLPFGRFDRNSGFLKPERIRQLYSDVFGDLRLEQLNPKTLLQVTDIETGLGCVLEEGPLADAVYASGAIFPILPPANINGRWYTDGFYTSSLPVMEAVKRQMDVIIAVIFEGPIHPRPRGFFSSFNNFYKIQTTAQTRNQLALSIDLHNHEIIVIKVPFERTIKMWDTDAVPKIMEAGKVAVENMKQEILSALEAFELQKHKTA